MKILKEHAGVLTNFEVLDLLKNMGATTDPLGSLGAVTPSECKVFDYLAQSPASNQSRDIIKEFWEKSNDFGLAKAEKLSIINTRPSSEAEIFPIVEKCEDRLDGRLEELMSLIDEILPPRPVKPEAEDEQQMEMDEKEGGDQ